ncbi:putative UBP type Zn finger protein [Cellulosimicrobium cellulans]|nr:putative UBP type Zn finger protein [Cellulosimicrobium cellulans]
MSAALEVCRRCSYTFCPRHVEHRIGYKRNPQFLAPTSCPIARWLWHQERPSLSSHGRTKGALG